MTSFDMRIQTEAIGSIIFEEEDLDEILRSIFGGAFGRDPMRENGARSLRDLSISFDEAVSGW